MPDQPAATVYFDGSCPLCSAEIALYRRQSEGKALCFVDVSTPGASLGHDLDRRRAMRRFHVRKEDGRLVSGAAAFVELWKQLPGWRWAARAAAIPGVMALMEMAYWLFLSARPNLARLFAALSSGTRVGTGSSSGKAVSGDQDGKQDTHEATCYRSEPGHRA